MNVIRMIKLFGWEKQMEDKVAQKRNGKYLWLLPILWTDSCIPKFSGAQDTDSELLTGYCWELHHVLLSIALDSFRKLTSIVDSPSLYSS
jgi:hypothetical protein